MEPTTQAEQTALLVAGVIGVAILGVALANHTPTCPVCGSPDPCPHCPDGAEICINYSSN